MEKKTSVIRKVAVFVIAAGIGLLMGLVSPVYVYAQEGYPYQIQVNRAANCVTVYEKDEEGNYTLPVKSMVCSCGAYEGSTPLGSFKTSNYYNWRLMVDGTYGQYAIRFNGPILFHSVPYYTQSADTLKWDQYNKLGEAASLGCVRLAASDVKWLYDNCPVGTQVIVYDDIENPGPLGKPEQMKISEESPFKNWDPTDVNARNPWLTIKPSLYLKNDMGDGVLYLPVGAALEDLKSIIGVRDAFGEEYPEEAYEIYLNGRYDLDTFGAYKVWVQAKDITGMMIEEEMMLAMVYMGS